MNNIEQISKVINEIVELKGNAVFEDSKLFCALLDDYAVSDEKPKKPLWKDERNIFRQVLDDNILKEIGELFNGASAQRNVSWARVRLKLKEDQGRNEEWCKVIIDSFSGSSSEQEDASEQNKLGDKYYNGDGV